MKEAKILPEIKHDNIVALLEVCEKQVSLMMELCEFDFEPFNVDKKVSSLDQFLSYMNEGDIFDSSPCIGNVIASDVVRAVSYLHSRDTVRRDIKPAIVWCPIPIVKVTNTKNRRWRLTKAYCL